MNNKSLGFCTVCKLELDVVALFNSVVTAIFSLKQGKGLPFPLSFIKERNIVTLGTQQLAQL